jgi:primosomal protein N' (replication factor Y)
MLRAASPPNVVRNLPPAARHGTPADVATTVDERRLVHEGLAAGQAVLRLPPAHDPFPLLAAVATRGPALVITPSVAAASGLARGLTRRGQAVVAVPSAWAQAAAGGATVVGARTAAWAPAPDMSAVVVLDAHDEGLVEERAPGWSAWIVAAERARRAGVPCLLISSCPTLEQLAWGRLVLPARAAERDGWAPVVVVDRRADDPRSGLFSAPVVDLLRDASPQGKVVCVLNRKGRARLLACRVCRELAVCERCRGAVEQTPQGSGLRCARCGLDRPAVCANCGSGALRVLRSGVTRVRDELEALVRVPVGEVTGDIAEVPDAPVLIGTEAVLHRLGGQNVRAVVFLEGDAELSAPRYRAGEQALALVSRAARLVGGRRGGGVVAVQTRQPSHPVLEAAVHADPGRLADAERAVRRELGLPPFSALAELSGQAAPAFAARLAGVEVTPTAADRWLVRALDHRTLCDALAAAPRPEGRLRVVVDPLRV